MSHIPKNSSTGNNNYMSTIETNIQNNINSFKYLINYDRSDGAKADFRDYAKRNTDLQEIQFTLLDKTILSLINKRKLPYKDYQFLFYLFFKRENFRAYTIKFHHKNLGKFLKKFFTTEFDKTFSQLDMPNFIIVFSSVVSATNLSASLHNIIPIVSLSTSVLSNLSIAFT